MCEISDAREESTARTKQNLTEGREISRLVGAAKTKKKLAGAGLSEKTGANCADQK